MKKLFGLGPDVVGDGRVIFEWSPRGNFLAVAGSKRRICILDRNGKQLDEAQLPPADAPLADPRASSASAMQWDPAGELLAVVPSGSACVLLWSSQSREFQKIDSDFKAQEISAIGWSKNSVYLACGTAKGNLMIYNARERRKVQSMGKHTKRIVACVWNKDNVLAMAGQDCQVTLSDGVSGDTVNMFKIKDVPQDLCVSDRKDDGYARREENTYSLIIARKTLFIQQVGGSANKPMELAFMDTYGPLMKHAWYGDGYMMLGFRNGYLVLVSSHSREISEEVHSGKYLDILNDVAHCPALNRIAMGGANSIRIMEAGNDYQELKGDAIDLDPNQSVEKLGWTRDGQVLTASTHNGYLYSYLAALPVVFDHYGSHVIYLTSLQEMSVMDITRRHVVSRLRLDSEPAFCGLGPSHAAVGMNNQVAFYSVSDGRMVNRRDYLASVSSIKLNDTHAAALMGNQVVVHAIEAEPNTSMDDTDITIPTQAQRNSPLTLTCVALTNHFVIVGSHEGVLSYYLTPDVTPVNEFRHEGSGITRLWPQPTGARLVFEDEKSGLFLFNPVNDHSMGFPEFSGRCEGVMWDSSDPNVLVLADTNSLWVYVYIPASLSGPLLQLVVRQALPSTHTPLVLNNGSVGCRLKTGAVDTLVLESHRMLQPGDAVARSAPQKRFAQSVKLFKLKDAYDVALTLKQPDLWRQLASAALDVLDVDMAIAVYRQMGDASMVLSLERIRGYEDRNLLAGHILVLQERDYAQAQELFLRSSIPRAALDMRMDLKHWADALKLAEQHDPDNIGLICKEHAAMQEMTGEYAASKAHYQQALEALGRLAAQGEPNKDLELSCRSGIARVTLQLGDLRQGRQMALQIGSKDLFKECALVLEQMQQLTEAAEMYERAGMYERAASIYIQTKNFTAAAPLMARISSSKLQLQFAKAKEAEGRYQEAVQAYEAAGDVESTVRLYLDRLSAPQKAYSIVRKTQSVEAATLLVKYCLQTQDFQGAVEFLLMANQMDQAFDIAQGRNEMDTFARIVSSQAKAVDFQRIAQYYESRGEFDKAGDMWVKCEQHPRAVQLYLKVGVSAVDKAIAVVEKTKAHQLGVVVLDYVNEETDGSARDEFRFKLNIAMGQYADAAKDAVDLARLEQELGNYRLAHDKLFATHKQLEGLNAKPTMELTRALMLLHSYTLVKSLIAVNDHLNAARMLVRVARSISKFPMHIVPILTSTVIECHRAGLKKTAFEYASMLMRPEYRDQVAPKYKKKIELMVRKPDKDAEEVEEAMVDCCFCNMPGPETELQCMACQNLIPFDIASGKRMSLTDWTECSHCKFPASMGQFSRILQAEGRCPMCNDPVDAATIRRVMDPAARLKAKAGTDGGANSASTPMANGSGRALSSM